MKRIFTSPSRVVALILSLILLSQPPTASAQSNWLNNSDCTSQGVATIQGIECLLENILVVAIQLVGIIMLIMLIIGGFKYLTAQGDPKAIEAARSTLTKAITGLFLAISAWMILLLISQFTGVTSFLNFDLNLDTIR